MSAVRLENDPAAIAGQVAKAPPRRIVVPLAHFAERLGVTPADVWAVVNAGLMTGSDLLGAGSAEAEVGPSCETAPNEARKAVT